MSNREQTESQLLAIRKDLTYFLENGYSKAALARELEISRSTFLRLLEDESYVPTHTIIGRMRLKLDWLRKSYGHELLECLTLLFFQRPNILPYFEAIVEKAERHTGFFVGYHGVVFGGPVGFIIMHTPGLGPLSEVLSTKPFPEAVFGRTETFMIGTTARLTGNHDAARAFYAKHPQARMYLKLFQSFSASAGADLEEIQRIMIKKHHESIFCLESGLLTGRYDYFILVIAKDERAYLNLLTGDDGIYAVTSKRMTDSITLSVTPQGVRPLFAEDYYNLSYTQEQVATVRTKKRRRRSMV